MTPRPGDPLWLPSAAVVLVTLAAMVVVRVEGDGTMGPPPTRVGTVHERKLVKESPSYRSIIKENRRYCEDEVAVKNFDNPTLVYVTPWCILTSSRS